MSKIALTPDAAGTGVFTIASPATSTNRTLTLPDQSGTVLTGAGPLTVNASAPTQAATIDASGSVIVGESSTGAVVNSTGGTGAYISADGQLVVSNVSNRSIFNRKTTDGDILEFRKDGAVVGSIGVAAGDNLYIGSTAANHGGIYMNDTGVLPMSGGSLTDNTRDLGGASNRWNDLFLGGGVYLGGTAAANKLSDAEYGSFVPTLYTSNFTNSGISTNVCSYFKVGTMVHLQFRISFAGTSGDWSVGNYIEITNLPFRARSATNVDEYYTNNLSGSSSFASNNRVWWDCLTNAYLMLASVGYIGAGGTNRSSAVYGSLTYSTLE